MITNGDTFAACFGSDPGEDTTIFARQVRYALRCGYGIHFVEPGTKIRACPLSDKARSAADKAARTAATEAGKRAPKGHHCAHEPFLVTDETPNAAEQAQRTATRLAKSRGRMNLAVDLPGSRLVAVDCDTPEQQAAFLDAWSTATGADESHRSYTVTSPGTRSIAADGTETWAHHGGGHYLFAVPADVELPPAPGSITGHGGWELKWTGSVMAPPSRRPEGSYRVVSTVQPLPDWIRERIEAAGGQAAAERERRLSLPERDPGNDIDEYFAGISWERLLGPDGWVNGQIASCGCGTFTAPGDHGSPRSATAHEPDCAHLDRPGSGLLHLWTSQPPDYLDGAGRDLSKLTYLAHSRHSGSVSAAMREVGLTPESEAGEATVLTQAPARAGGVEPDEDTGQQAAGPATAGESDRLDELAGIVFARESLAKIRTAATAARVPVWLLLGSVLAQLATRHSPQVRLPAMVGTAHSPLNLLVGLVGQPGAGKGMAMAAGSDVLGCRERVSSYEIATSRGVASAYAEPLRSDGIDPQHTDAVLFTADEVDSIAAHFGGSSALSATLRTAFSGGHLGGKVREAKNDIHVLAGRYRFVLLAGVQPARSGVLLNDGGSGLAARWLLLPAMDPHLDPPGAAGTWEPMGFEPLPDLAAAGAGYSYELARGEQVMTMPEVAVHEIQRTYTAQFDPGASEADYDAARDGHRLNVRARVAALLALLEHRLIVTEQDWEVAGGVLAASDIGRGMCERALAREARQRVDAKAAEHSQIELARTDAAQQHRNEQRERVHGRVTALVRNTPGLTRNEIKDQLTRQHRAHFGEVFAEMVDEGELRVESVMTTAGRRTRAYRLVE